MVGKLKRPSKIAKRHAAAKALGSRLYRQRVVAGKKRKAQAKLARLSHWIPPGDDIDE